MSFIVAIDGPTSSGKSTIANLIAKDMGFLYVQTGAMYRCVALEMLRKEVAENDVQSISRLLNNIEINFSKQKERQDVLINSEIVTDLIRTKEITDFTSKIASIDIVRHKLLELQRKMANNSDIVMEGRDIGTNVFPNADIKFFLTAPPLVRAKRKQEELRKIGENHSFLTVLESIYKWDKDAIERKVGALKRADGSIYIDSSQMEIEELKNLMLNNIKESYNKKIDVERE